jgi:hypothetical protein
MVCSLTALPRMGLFGVSCQFDPAAHALYFQRGRACVDAGLAADGIDHDAAAINAVHDQLSADYADVERGTLGDMQFKRTRRHRIVAVPVEHAGAALRLDLDRQGIIAAGDCQRLGAVAKLAAHLHLVAIPGCHGHRAFDIADADMDASSGVVAQIDRCVGQRLADAQTQQQGNVARGSDGRFHGHSHDHFWWAQPASLASWRSCIC